MPSLPNQARGPSCLSNRPICSKKPLRTDNEPKPHLSVISGLLSHLGQGLLSLPVTKGLLSQLNPGLAPLCVTKGRLSHIGFTLQGDTVISGRLSQRNRGRLTFTRTERCLPRLGRRSSACAYVNAARRIMVDNPHVFHDPRTTAAFPFQKIKPFILLQAMIQLAAQQSTSTLSKTKYRQTRICRPRHPRTVQIYLLPIRDVHPRPPPRFFTRSHLRRKVFVQLAHSSCQGLENRR